MGLPFPRGTGDSGALNQMRKLKNRKVSVVQAKAGITEDVSNHMLEHSKELSKARKKRVMPAGLATAQEIEAFSLLSSHPLHKSTKVPCLPRSLPPLVCWPCMQCHSLMRRKPACPTKWRTRCWLLC